MDFKNNIIRKIEFFQYLNTIIKKLNALIFEINILNYAYNL